MDLPLLRRSLGAIALAAAACLPAQASIVDFEDVIPGSFLMPAVMSGGYTFASGGLGFSGVDDANAFSVFGNAPDNSTGQFLYALNDDTITLTLGGERFLGFDMAFIGPVLFSPGTSAGRLLVEAQTTTGLVTEVYDFGVSNANGVWEFFSVTSSTLSSSSVSSVTFSACLYDGNGGCGIDPFVPAQFALDNIHVPEPGSAALALVALCLLVSARRRAGA
jgi:MYXO-CTERM domain-containing protein